MIINENKKCNRDEKQISIHDFKFEEMQTFVYLASQVNKSNVIKHEAKRRIKSANKC